MNVILHEKTDSYEKEYLQIRQILVGRGTSLNSWLTSKGINRQAAYRALKGQSFGRKSIDLRVAIIKELLATA